MHVFGDGRARHSVWYENSFIMVVYEKLKFSQNFLCKPWLKKISPNVMWWRFALVCRERIRALAVNFSINNQQQFYLFYFNSFPVDSFFNLRHKLEEIRLIMSFQNKTRLHSSRMHTARLLAASPSMHWTRRGGVSAPRGGLPLVRGVYPSMQWGRHHPTPLWTESQTSVKT